MSPWLRHLESTESGGEVKRLIGLSAWLDPSNQERPAVNQYQSTLATLLLTATAATPCAAQQAPSTPQVVLDEICPGCFAYLVFPPSLEPESYATRDQVTDIPQSLPTAAAPRQQPVDLAAASKQEPRIAGARHDHEQELSP